VSMNHIVCVVWMGNTESEQGGPSPRQALEEGYVTG
jgi:hypothetical protein